MAEHMQSKMIDKKVPRCTKVARKNDDRGNDEESSKKRKFEQLRERPQSSNTCYGDGSSGQRVKTESEQRKHPECNQNCTKEQVQVVQRILKCKNLYDVLEVPKDASVLDIKKAFKRLALIVHPDKNGHPDANKAMQRVAVAGDVLADAEKRRIYDLEQTESQNDNKGFHFEDSSGGLRFDPGTVMAGLVILVGTVALVGVVKAVIDYFKSEPDKEESFYSFIRTNIYTVERRTENLKIRYYVKRSFRTDVTVPLWQLEIFIEEEYQKKYSR